MNNVNIRRKAAYHHGNLRPALIKAALMEIAAEGPEQFSLRGVAIDAPVLIVHDKGDRPNPFRHGQALADAWPNAELMATEGLGHRKVLANPAVSARIRTFLKGE